MNTSLKLLALTSAALMPALASWFAEGGSFPLEILLGGYASFGLLLITALSYSPAGTRYATTASAPDRSWIKRSLGRRSALRATARISGL